MKKISSHSCSFRLIYYKITPRRFHFLFEKYFRVTSKFFIGLLFLFFLFILLPYFMPSQLLQVNQDLLFVIYFKELLLPILFLCIAWLILALKHDTSNIREYFLLNSLPMKDNQILFHIFFNELMRFIWVPFGITMFYLAFFRAASVVFVLRLFVLVWSIYNVLIIFKLFIQIKLDLRKRGLQKYRFLEKNHPLVQTLIVIAFVFMQTIFVISPRLVVQFWFLFILLLLLFIGVVFYYVISSVFLLWRRQNIAFLSGEEKLKIQHSDSIKKNVWLQIFKWRNPLLTKHLLQITHEKTNMTNILLTLILILAGYGISMNNENIQDSIFVLLGLFIIYAFLMTIRLFQQAEDESPQLFFSLPIRVIQFYVALCLPIDAWLLIIAFLLTILLFISGSSLIQSAWFLEHAVLVIVVSTIIGVNCILAYYPDSAAARKKFYQTILSLLVLGAVFFKFLLIVVFLLFVISFTFLRKVKLYQI